MAVSYEEFIALINKRVPPHLRGAAYAHALEIYGPKPQTERFASYKFNPTNYFKNFLGWSAWDGIDDEHPGQSEIINACSIAVEQQIEKRDFEKGILQEHELKYWKFGDTIKNWIRVESGNGIGKTKLLSGAVQWFFDCFDSVVYTFHTNATQDLVTTWAEIGQDREGKGLPGKLNKTQIYLSPNRFATTRTTSNAGGAGEEGIKGKHKPFLLFVVDEADGIEDWKFKAIETMASGGVVIVLMTANPRSRSSYFHKIKRFSYSKTFRISSLYHPNVVQGREVIAGAVMRDFIEKSIENGCEVLDAHDEDLFTFELPYAVKVADIIHPAGTVFKPDADFMTRILGIAPPTLADKTIIPTARYEAACERKPTGLESTDKLRIGVDAARWGSDVGTVYFHWQNKIWRECELYQQETYEYKDAIKAAVLKFVDKGVTSCHIRIDAGYGQGVIDMLRKDDELIKAFHDFQVLEVPFGGSANDNQYYNLVTEMYYQAAETIKTLCVVNPPESLEADLCEREYDWRNRSGVDQKILEPKKDFKKRKHRSPDDGDGFVLAAAPDFIFQQKLTVAPMGISKDSIWLT